MSPSVHTFRKPEHLCSRSDIEKLFSAGSRSFTLYPLRVTYRQVTGREGGPAVKVLLSVSKRKLRHAVDRNRAKRQLREAYRLQKHLLLSALPEDVKLHIAFIWLSDHSIESRKIAARMQTILQRIGEQYAERKETAETTSSAS